MELPMKNRSFSLTSHQLRALTHLACTLLGFERIVKELVTNMTFTDCTGETPCVKGTAPSPQNTQMCMHTEAVATSEITEVMFSLLFLGI